MKIIRARLDATPEGATLTLSDDAMDLSILEVLGLKRRYAEDLVGQINAAADRELLRHGAIPYRDPAGDKTIEPSRIICSCGMEYQIARKP